MSLRSQGISAEWGWELWHVGFAVIITSVVIALAVCTCATQSTVYQLAEELRQVKADAADVESQEPSPHMTVQRSRSAFNGARAPSFEKAVVEKESSSSARGPVLPMAGVKSQDNTVIYIKDKPHLLPRVWVARSSLATLRKRKVPSSTSLASGFESDETVALSS